MRTSERTGVQAREEENKKRKQQTTGVELETKRAGGWTSEGRGGEGNRREVRRGGKRERRQARGRKTSEEKKQEERRTSARTFLSMVLAVILEKLCVVIKAPCRYLV